MASWSISCSVRPPGSGLVTSSSSRSRSVRSLAKASSRVEMPFSGASALAMARIRPGTRGSVGGTKTSSTPSRITCIRAGSTRKSRAMSRAEDSDGVRIRRACRATLPCIRRKPYQRRSDSRLRQVGASCEVDAAVEGDRVVHGGDQRQPQLLDVEHAVAEHLVVVDDVEVVDPRPQQPRDPGAERLGLGEPGRAHGEELLDVHQVAELPQPRHPERVGLAVEVQARHLRQPDARVELRVGLAGEHLDLVPEVDQLPAEVPDVDALPAAVRLGAVGQERDAQCRGLSANWNVLQ